MSSCRESARVTDGDAAAVTATSTADLAGVTLTGQVAASLGDHLIQLGNGPAEPVLVVVPTANTVPVGARVEVSGRIRTLERERLAAELGVDLGPEAQPFEGARCLVAVMIRAL